MTDMAAVSPVFHVERYADVRAALLDARMDMHKPVAAAEGEGRSESAGARRAPERARHLAMLSRTLAEHLSAAAVAPLAARVADMAADSLEQGRRRGGMDLIADLAYPLPLMVMQDLLGLPHAEIDPLRPLFATIAAGHDIGGSEAQRQAARFALHAMMHWLAPQLDTSDSPLVAAIRAIAEKASVERMVPYWCGMILFAGSTTTRDFIGNALARLIEHPGEAEHLRREPAMLDGAIEELLRVEGPVQAVGRVAREEMVIGGQTLSRGAVVYLHLHAANHDPDIFAEPQRVDFTRSPNPHLAFGLGVAHCLGAHLARLEARAVLAAALPRLARMRLTAAPESATSSVLRGRTRLAVDFG